MQEDTYEAVKTHMFELLGELAACFVPEQLNMLFAKLERSQERSVQDTKRLLTLLQHLAQSDRGVSGRLHNGRVGDLGSSLRCNWFGSLRSACICLRHHWARW